MIRVKPLTILAKNFVLDVEQGFLNVTLLRKSVDWFLYDIGLCHVTVKLSNPNGGHGML